MRHGHNSRKNGQSATYKSWAHMKQRCRNKNNKWYSYYGGRGITFCEQWDDFVVFLADMGERPKGKTLDRIDNGGPYAPENCRWATPKQQIANSRPHCKTRFHEKDGKIQSLRAWERELKIDRRVIKTILKEVPFSIACKALRANNHE